MNSSEFWAILRINQFLHNCNDILKPRIFRYVNLVYIQGMMHLMAYKVKPYGSESLAPEGTDIEKLEKKWILLKILHLYCE